MNKEALLEHFNELKSKGLNIDATRGRPCKEQLDLSLDMLDIVNSKSDFEYENVDVRNYGKPYGLECCKQLIGDIVGEEKKNVIIFGNSSLNIMFDLIAKSTLFGVCGNSKWTDKKVKWLCVVPGYDRHFAITERFGFEMISIPLNSDGPDMDLVEKYVQDPEVKGIWCVPKYANPTGTTYSNEVVERFAKLKPAAKDFRVYWDNAYCVHDFDPEHPKELLNIFEEARKYGNEDMFYEFISFSKISFNGGGLAAVVASDNNIKDIQDSLSIQTIGYDKLNQIRHVLYLKNKNGVKNMMKKHAEIIRPRFEFVDNYFSKEIKDIASWEKPEGGYFICLKVKNCAKEVIARCAECGVKLTPAGCCTPYHLDKENTYIRIAPSTLRMCSLEDFADVVSTAIKIETK